jgi:hypothetical protein
LRQARGKAKRGEKVKLSLKRLKDIIHEFVTKRGRIQRLIFAISAMASLSLKRLNDITHFITKRRRTVRLIFAIFAVAFLCVMLSGLTLTQLTSDYRPPSWPSGTNEVTNPTPTPTTPTTPTTETISNVGSLKTIGIGAYWDENLTNRVNQINWGLLEPGGQKSFSIYLHNEGNSAVTLIRSLSNWNPSAATTYLTLNWNYNGQTIEAGKNLQVTLTLSVNTDIIGITNFSFDITVVGTG